MTEKQVDDQLFWLFIASDKMADDLRSYYKKWREYYIHATGIRVKEEGLFYSGYIFDGNYG